jgi:hypothetical protein
MTDKNVCPTRSAALLFQQRLADGAEVFFLQGGEMGKVLANAGGFVAGVGHDGLPTGIVHVVVHLRWRTFVTFALVPTALVSRVPPGNVASRSRLPGGTLL